MRFAIGPLLLCLALAGCGAKDSRLAVHPVRGKVMLGPTPAAGAMVVFHPLDKKDDRAVPRGKVDKDGTFKLSTYDADDGAPVGKYKVTIDWRKGATLDDDGVSLVHARYTRPASTPIEVEITPETTELKPFEITK
jgi:N-methylhydantoinase B/oxoprolinase/acetone carboxylase alpha subunit